MKMNEYLHKKGFPQEIINLIGDYSSKDFKPDFQKSLHFINFATFCNNEPMQCKIFNKIEADYSGAYQWSPGGEKCPSFKFFIEKHLDLNKANDYIFMLSKCNCCDIHKQKRPLSIKNMNGTPQPGHLNPDIDHWEKMSRCQCNCRHFSRHICRTINGY